jgi:hypothetical protein
MTARPCNWICNRTTADFARVAELRHAPADHSADRFQLSCLALPPGATGKYCKLRSVTSPSTTMCGRASMPAIASIAASSTCRLRPRGTVSPS